MPPSSGAAKPESPSRTISPLGPTRITPDSSSAIRSEIGRAHPFDNPLGDLASSSNHEV